MASRIKRKAKKTKGPPSVVRGIKGVEDLQENHVCLFYGKSGRGKTELASTFPTPILFLDINNERGLKTIKGKKGIQVAQVRSWDDFEDLHWWLREEQEFKTIVLDQITGLQDLCMRHVREKLNMKDDASFFRKHWGHLSGDMKTWLQNYRELADLYNIVFIAHERAFGSDDDEEDGEIDPSVGARVMPSVGSFVDGACDIIGQSFIRTIKERDKKGKVTRRTEYCLRIGPHPVYTTKIRRPKIAGRLPDFIIDPSYKKLIAIEAGEDLEAKTIKRRKKHGKG